MNIIKKITLSALVLLMAIPAVLLDSCAKGPNDPGLSFRSRTKRVEGDWTVTSLTTNQTLTTRFEKPADEIDDNTVSTSTKTFTQTNYSDLTGSGSFSGTVEAHSYLFDTDGNVTFTQNYTILSPSSNPENSVTTTIEINRTGFWSFLGENKIQEYKNKQRLGIKWATQNSKTEIKTVDDGDESSITTDIESTFTTNDMDEVWNLTLLKNEEINAEVEESSEIKEDYTDTEDTDNNTTTTVSTKGSSTIILKQGDALGGGE